jgi:ankyrin repeat protein
MSQEWFAAAGRGDTETVLNLLHQGADVNAADEFGRTALTLSVLGRQIAMIRMLLDHGANPNAQDHGSCTPMTEAVVISQAWAVREPDVRPLEMLLAAGGRLGLREAVLMGDVALARRLCDADPSLDVSGDAQFIFHDTYLMEAIRRGSLDMATFLLDRGAEIEGTDDLGATALMRGAAEGRADIVTRLLDRGADVNHDDWSDQTPLSEAAVNGHREIVDLLLSRGAERSLLDAVALDETDLVAELLRGGSDPNHLYYGRGRLVMYAVSRGNAAIVRLLLDHGAAHHHETFDEHPLLAEAARHGHLDVVKLLIDHGADLNGVGRDGLTPLAWATKEGHAPVVEFLGRADTEDSPQRHKETKE